MNDHQRLLNEAARFCNPTTGEVVELIPEELMKLLPRREISSGIWGEQGQTATNAKWYVFLDDDIRDQAFSKMA